MSTTTASGRVRRSGAGVAGRSSQDQHPAADRNADQAGNAAAQRDLGGRSAAAAAAAAVIGPGRAQARAIPAGHHVLDQDVPGDRRCPGPRCRAPPSGLRRRGEPGRNLDRGHRAERAGHRRDVGRRGLRRGVGLARGVLSDDIDDVHDEGQGPATRMSGSWPAAPYPSWRERQQDPAADGRPGQADLPAGYHLL